MIAIVCPGQGAQSAGFLAPWLELSAFRDTMIELENHSKVELIEHGTNSDADTIRDTAIAQPLIVAAGLASATVLLGGQSAKEFGLAGIAGHSVGEITAAALSGVLSNANAIQFVTARGNAMAAAAALEQTTMAAVVGGNEVEVIAKLAELNLEPANFNGGGQIVAAGTAEAIALLQENPPAGTRVIALQVAGAFHTRFMRPAVAALTGLAENIACSDPQVKLWTNSTGQLEPNGRHFVDKMVQQVSNPVRWDLCMASMVETGVTALIELAPAGTLVGLAKRSMPGVETVAVKTPENLDAALSLINNHR